MRSARRSPSPTCPSSSRWRAHRARSRCSANASPRPSRTSHFGTRKADGSGRSARRGDVRTRKDRAVPVGLEALRLVADAFHVEVELFGWLHARERVVHLDTGALLDLERVRSLRAPGEVAPATGAG